MSVDSALTVLCLLGALQGVLLAVAVGSLGEGLRRSNRALAVILFGAAGVMVVILVSHRPADGERFGLELLEFLMWVFSGPVFYLYVRLVVGRDRRPARSFALHFLPGLLWLAYLAAWSVHSLRAAGGEAPAAPWRPPVLSMMLYQMSYTALALWRWRQAGRAVACSPSPGPHDFWVPALITALMVQHLAQWVRWVFRDQQALRDVVPLAGAVTFVVLSFLGLRNALPLLSRQRRRYAGSSLTEERSRILAERLDALMETDRPYLRTDLALEELAAELGVPKTHLSQVVNERFEQSFLEFVARYRTRESERLLADESTAHLTIEALARRSGFKSRSAFYQAFRRHNGSTPSEFRRRAAAR